VSKHAIVHVEIPAKDPKAGGKFYADLFGWNLQHDEQFDYTMFQGADGPGGGFTKVGENGAAGSPTQPGDVIVYVSTDDIDATLAKAESLGGKTVTPKMEIPGVGWLAIFADPTGNRIGLYTSMQPQS
jgi:predicted enzyme related to lactoylglutathione lyase